MIVLNSYTQISFISIKKASFLPSCMATKKIVLCNWYVRPSVKQRYETVVVRDFSFPNLWHKVVARDFIGTKLWRGIFPFQIADGFVSLFRSLFWNYKFMKYYKCVSMHTYFNNNARYSVTGFEQNRSSGCRTRSSYQGDWRGLFFN
jgi:hypothetical protein